MNIVKTHSFFLAVFMVALLTSSIASAVLADEESEDTVHTFFIEGQDRATELAENFETLQNYLRNHFSVVDFAWRTAPNEAWNLADDPTRRRYIDVVFCRLAKKRIAGISEAVAWRILGSRDTDVVSTVGVIVTHDDGRERRILFDVRRSQQRIIDVRSEGRRLSNRLAQDFLREAGEVRTVEDAAYWLDRIVCTDD